MANGSLTTMTYQAFDNPRRSKWVQGSGPNAHTADYWPYGEMRTSTGSKTSPWGFVRLLGYLTDLANRLYVRARHYRPNVGQWQTVDPLWPDESAYGYVNSRPTQSRDPEGLSPRGDCYWNLILLGKTPYYACIKCSPVGFRDSKCNGLPIRPVSKARRALFAKLFTLCGSQSQYDCCEDIALNQGEILSVAAIGQEITACAHLGCVNRCQAAMKEDPPSQGDILRGFAACLGENPNDPGPLGFLKGLLEGAHAL